MCPLILCAWQMIVKIIARGFILHKHAYLRESWNWLDFVVVMASLISLSSTFGNVQVTFRLVESRAQGSDLRVTS